MHKRLLPHYQATTMPQTFQQNVCAVERIKQERVFAIVLMRHFVLPQKRENEKNGGEASSG
jgi:hypothetical protein